MIVIRPAGTKKKAKLPVLVWVYGGGLFAGSTADPQYNVSGIAKVSQDLKKPVIVGAYITTLSFIPSPFYSH
jgi:carboxylesterase type B